MATCVPKIVVTHFTPTGNCAEVCDGISLGAPKLTSKMDAQGQCVFTYEVTRSPDGKVFSGKKTVGCTGTDSVDLYCTSDENCLLMRIEFQCVLP